MYFCTTADFSSHFPQPCSPLQPNSLEAARKAALLNRLRVEADRASRRRRRRQEIRELKAIYGADYALYVPRRSEQDEDEEEDGGSGSAYGDASSGADAAAVEDQEEEGEEEARYLDMLEERHNNMRIWHAAGLEIK